MTEEQLSKMIVHQHHHDVVHDQTKANSFCDLSEGSSIGTVSYIDGFHYTLSSSLSSHNSFEEHTSSYPSTATDSVPPSPPCLNYYLSSLTIDNPLKFLLAIITSFSLAIGLEYISYVRIRHLQYYQQRILTSSTNSKSHSKHEHVKNNYTTTNIATNTRMESVTRIPKVTSAQRKEEFVHQIILYAVQQFGGYVLMLSFMTLSIEIWFGSLLGLMVGHYLSIYSNIVSTANTSFSGSSWRKWWQRRNSKWSYPFSTSQMSSNGINNGGIATLSTMGSYDDDNGNVDFFHTNNNDNQEEGIALCNANRRKGE